jgi:hypothetical protein
MLIMRWHHTLLRRYVRVEATSMAEADMQSALWARLLGARDWAIGVNAQSAK